MNYKSFLMLVLSCVVVVAVVYVVFSNADDNHNLNPGEVEYSHYVFFETDGDMPSYYHGIAGISYNTQGRHWNLAAFYIENVGSSEYEFNPYDWGYIDQTSVTEYHDGYVRASFAPYGSVVLSPGESYTTTFSFYNDADTDVLHDPDINDGVTYTAVDYVMPEPSIDMVRTELVDGDSFYVVTDFVGEQWVRTMYGYTLDVQDVGLGGYYDVRYGFFSNNGEQTQTFDEIVNSYSVALSVDFVESLNPSGYEFELDTFLGPKTCMSVTEYLDTIPGYVNQVTYYIGSNPSNGYYPVYQYVVTYGFYGQLTEHRSYIIACSFFDEFV